MWFDCSQKLHNPPKCGLIAPKFALIAPNCKQYPPKLILIAPNFGDKSGRIASSDGSSRRPLGRN